MAIKINAGTAPQLGRITLPKGTYLPQKFDNPSAAADGGGGIVSGGNTPGSMWGNVTPGYNAPLGQFGQNQQSGNGMWNPNTNPYSAYQFKSNPFEKIFEYALRPKVFTPLGYQNIQGAPKPPTPTILSKPNTSPTSPTNNSLVGSDLLQAPNQMTIRQVQSVFGGMTPDQINQVMTAKGYTRTYQAGVGEVFVLTGNPQQQQQPTLDSRGRPDWVDPASLQRGESVTTSAGFTFVGGTPYTNPNTGETVAQYAMTVPGVKDDPKGMYKWKSTIKQDANGNWVKIYSQQLRGRYTKAGQKRIEAKREAQAQQEAAVSGVEPISPNAVGQLVNLRADYG